MKLLVCTSIVFLAVSAKHEQYSGWKSYFISPQSKTQLEGIGALMQDLELDFIGKPSVGRDGEVIVKPQHLATFIKTLEAYGVPHRLRVGDIARALQKGDEEIVKKPSFSLNGKKNGRMPYDDYQRLNVYDEYLKDIANRFPNHATVVSPADTFEGRPINVLKISTTNFEDNTKPIIFIDAAIHAREWIAPPVVAWAIHNLLENSTETDLVDNFDWILIPVANPDGYEFSHTDDRMWRKNRSPNPSNSSCLGVDGNRNYDFFWNTIGVDKNPCAITYPGHQAFSEIETRVIRDLLFEHLDRISLYITLHSYGSMILYPWGHDGSLPDNDSDLQVVGDAMADAIHSHSIPEFPRYLVGNSVSTIGYGASGASEDYARSIGVPLAYTIELPGLLDGFLLDPQYIEQVCKETWAGIAAGARRSVDFLRK